MSEIKSNQPEVILEVKHDTCPVCHKGIGIMRKISNDEKEAGKMNKAMSVEQRMVIPIADPTKPLFIVPTIILTQDVCENPECGAVFATSVTVVKLSETQLMNLMRGGQQAPPPQQARPTPGQRPGFQR